MTRKKPNKQKEGIVYFNGSQWVGDARLTPRERIVKSISLNIHCSTAQIQLDRIHKLLLLSMTPLLMNLYSVRIFDTGAQKLQPRFSMKSTNDGAPKACGLKQSKN